MMEITHFGQENKKMWHIFVKDFKNKEITAFLALYL